jgi:hypothetical protein
MVYHIADKGFTADLSSVHEKLHVKTFHIFRDFVVVRNYRQKEKVSEKKENDKNI